MNLSMLALLLFLPIFLKEKHNFAHILIMVYQTKIHCMKNRVNICCSHFSVSMMICAFCTDCNLHCRGAETVSQFLRDFENVMNLFRVWSRNFVGGIVFLYQED